MNMNALEKSLIQKAYIWKMLSPSRKCNPTEKNLYMAVYATVGKGL